MTVFDCEKDSQGDWFTFFDSTFDIGTGEITYEDPKPDAAEFCIRSMGPFWDKQRKGRKREHKFTLNPVTRAMERVSFYHDLDPELEAQENDDAWEYAITGFKNAFSAPGVEMECNRENVLKLIEIPAFARFVQKVFLILSDVGVKAAGDKETNL